LLAAPQRGEVRGRGGARGKLAAEKRPNSSPASPIAPVNGVAERVLGAVGGEGMDAEHLGSGVGRRGGRRPPPQLLLDRRGDRHRGGAGQAGGEAAADRRNKTVAAAHEATS